MDNLSIQVRHDQLNAIIAALNKADTNTVEGIRKAIAKNILRLETEAKKNAPSVFGNLRAKIQSSQVGLEGRVSSLVSYARDVEEGTSPHYVPIDDLMFWFLRKNKIPLSEKKEYWPVVAAIRAKIAKKGTKAQPYLIPAFEFVSEKYFEDCKQVLNENWT